MKEHWVHTPTDTEIRRAITSFDIAWTDDGAAFDRWLAAHDAEVRAQTLRDAADAFMRETDDPEEYLTTFYAHEIEYWLRARADQ